MTNTIDKLKTFFEKDLWKSDNTGLKGFRRFLITPLQLLFKAGIEFFEGQITLRAMSLSYTILLSFIPLLAVSFSVLKAFGAHNQLEPFLSNFLTPFGAKGEEITIKTLEFVENMKVGVLGSVGLAILLYTVVSLLQKIEEAFNHIWRVKKPRGFVRRFSDYMSVILIGPVLIFSAIGITASIMSTTLVQKLTSMEPFGTAVYLISKQLPYIFVSLAFIFVYIAVPNTKVKFMSALTGGIFAGILWETIGMLFAAFIVSSAKYDAIYSGFAIVIMFMIWLYISNLILLVGAVVSFYHQNPHLLRVKRGMIKLSGRLTERVSLNIMFLIGYNYYHGKSPWTAESLSEKLDMPVEPILDVSKMLESKGLIIKTGENSDAFLPARDTDTITLQELLHSVRSSNEEALPLYDGLSTIKETEEVINKIDDACNRAVKDMSIKSLVLSLPLSEEKAKTGGFTEIE